jgi:hypothetical protein
MSFRHPAGTGGILPGRSVRVNLYGFGAVPGGGGLGFGLGCGFGLGLGLGLGFGFGYGDWRHHGSIGP